MFNIQDWVQRLEETRQGKNICDKCNMPKEVWGDIWCPRCDAPIPDKILVMDFVKSLIHLESLGSKDFKKKVWDYVVKSNNDFRNDSYIELNLPTNSNRSDWDDDRYKCGKITFEYLVKLSELVDFKYVIWYISW